MRKNIRGISIILKKSVFITLVLGCGTAPWLQDNVRLEKVSAKSPAKDKVVVFVAVSNRNNFKGKIVVGAEVNCGTVTWREKKKTAEIPANSTSAVTIEFEGIKDRIPTMAKKFEYQVRIYSSGDKVIAKSSKYTGTKPYGPPG